jgi:hypothetical protein
MRRMIVSILVCIAAVLSGCSDPYAEIKSMAGQTVPERTIVEGVVISDYASMNMGENPQLSWNEVDIMMSYKTAYIQSEDGKAGIKLIFDDIYENRMHRFSKVAIDIAGCEVSVDENGACTVRGIRAEDVTVVEEKVPVKPAPKKISDIKDSDIYTYVTICDVEFINKEGSYTNVNEYVVQASALNDFRKPKNMECIDVAGVYVRDGRGDRMFLPVNTSSYWRRRGDRLPDGVGCVSGILVPADFKRYGDVGQYALRLVSNRETDIPMDGGSNYETIAEWNWDRNYKHALNLEDRGLLKWVSGVATPAGRVLPDFGSGALYTTAEATYDLVPDYNTRSVHDGHRPGIGSRKAGALEIDSKTSEWFEDGAAIVVEVCTEGFRGKSLVLDFTWAAGKGKVDSSFGFPAYWAVEYSSDGVNYTRVVNDVLLRPVAYEKAPLSFYAVPGYTEHSVLLPKKLLGREKVYIRITPASDVMVETHDDPSEDINSGVYSPEKSRDFALVIGKISVSVLI